MLKVNLLEGIILSCNRVENENKKKFKIRGFVLAFVFLVGIFVLSLFVSQVVLAHDGGPPAPTVISISPGMKTTRIKPLITGVTVNKTIVDVYIDGVFNGRAQVKDGPSGTASFAYYPFLAFGPGKHTLFTVARTKEAPVLRSKESEKIEFEVIGFVTPTLFTPVFNLETTEFRPFIVGLAKNDSQIVLYLDGELEGRFLIKNHPSGTANFAYKPKRDLEVGIHRVQAVALDNETGQRSRASGLVIFGVENPYPAPTLFKPEVAGASGSRPYIIGLAKNDSLVDIYINGAKVATSIPVENGPAGVGSFAYRPEKDLRTGINSIFTAAFSPDGKMSRASNKVYHQVGEVAEKAPEVGKAEEKVVKVEPQKEKEPEEPKKPEVKEGEEPEVTLFPAVGEEAEGEVKIKKEKAEGEVRVTEEEAPEGEPKISGEAERGAEEPKEGEEEAEGVVAGEEKEEGGTNWSRIIGLVILAVLIIVLIIQLFSKDKGERTKTGETLNLFEEGSDKKMKGQESKKAGFEDSKSSEKKEEKKDEIVLPPEVPPPPPPSSNLPF